MFMNCKEAKNLGLTRYFTGKPCIHGHIAEHLVSNWTCCECLRLNKNEARHSPKTRDSILASQHRAYIKKREELQNDSAALEEYHAYFRKHAKISCSKRKVQRAAAQQKRKANNLQAMPSWLTKGHEVEIEGFYQFSKFMTKMTGIPYHVDHIYPLQGKTCKGLHVPWNLQVIPATENIRKSNKLPGAV